ncbi:MAG TPA: PIG-L family deacetylase [Candidatus Paceibacterota bacterium]|nr:PIG-L family deacetylase [Candidatus Paceibacterota bacterium]
MSNKLRVLAFTAHDDDVSIHTGGFIGACVDRGHEVFVQVMTLGQRDQRLPQFENKLAWDVRKAETLAAYAAYGIEPRFDLVQFEQEVDITQQRRNLVKNYIAEVKPDVFLSHWPVDVNPDHRASAVLMMESAYQRGVNPEIIFFQPHSAGRQSAATRPQVTCFIPTYYLPMTAALIERKRKATFCHVSQDPEGMWAGQNRTEEENLADVREHFPDFLPGVNQAEAYIAGKRAGSMIPGLREILTPTPFTLPRSVVRHDPSAYGVNEPSTLAPVAQAAE